MTPGLGSSTAAFPLTGALRRLAPALLAAAVLAACGGSSTPGDTTGPTVVITDNVPGATATGDVTFTFTFSEDVGTSFIAADVTVTGGTKGVFTKVSGTVTTLVVVPTPNTQGTINVSVAAGAFTDLAGNPSTGAASASQAYDTRVTLTQMTLPVSFDSATVNYGLVGFEGAEDSTIVADPAGGSNKVARVVKSATAQTFAGTTITAVASGVQTGFASAIPFDASNTRMTVRVYSPDAGIKVLLKVEDHTNVSLSVETTATTTVANAWEILTFDFAHQSSGAALDLTKSYDKATIFFNFGVAGATVGTAKTYYFDDLTFSGGGGTGGSGGSSATRVVFADDYAAGVTFAAFGGSTNALTVDPAEAHSGAASLRVEVPASGYTGGALVAAAPEDLSAYNAVSFWVKASKAATLNVVGLGNNAGAGPSLSAEVLQIPVTATWTRHIIPIPVPAKLTGTTGLFHFAEGADGGAYTLWFDDVAYVDLASTEVGAPVSAAIGWPAPTVAVGASYQMDRAPNAINWGGPVTTNGGNITNVGFRYFTLVSSAPAKATVDPDGVVTGVAAGTANITATLGSLVVPGAAAVTVTSPLGVPSTAAPTPTALPADVISMFSSVYTNVAVDTWSTDWSACCNTLTDPFDISGHAVKKYELRHFAGIEFFRTAPIDASAMGFFHLDVWMASGTELQIQLVNNVGASQTASTVTWNGSSSPALTTGAWTSIDIPMSAFSSLSGRNALGQMLLLVPVGTTGVFYVDNIYFHK